MLVVQGLGFSTPLSHYDVMLGNPPRSFRGPRTPDARFSNRQTPRLRSRDWLRWDTGQVQTGDVGRRV